CHMPYADEESCEVEQKGFLKALVDIFLSEKAAEPMKVKLEPVTPEPMPMEDPLQEPSPDGKCQEDQNYHHQYPSCPYTGRCYPDPIPSPAVPDVPQEKKDEEKSVPEKDKASEMPPSPKGPGAEEQDEESVMEFHLDTMEFRPSDAGLHRF